MKPEALFEVWSADEVAECLPGVSEEDYKMLWGVVDTATLPPPGETPDTCFERSLSKSWDRVPDDAKARLNALARAFEEEEDRKFAEREAAWEAAHEAKEGRV